ncbi:MAG: metallophosphoesterase family protein [archaeon]
MKFVFTADLHLKNWQDNQYTEEGIPLKLKEIINAFCQMCDYAMENEINWVIIAGDVNDTHSTIHARPFSMFSRILKSYPQLHFTIIPGNHDNASIKQTETAIDLLDYIDNVEVVNQTKEIKINDRKIVLVPWKRTMKDELKNAPGGDIMISHFALSEAFTSTNQQIRTSISKQDLKRWTMVLLGDYHKPQTVDNFIWYVGSPVPTERSEFKEEKRFLVIDVEDLSIKSVPTTGYRKYIEFNILDDAENLDEIKDTIIKECKNGNFIRLNKYSKELPKEIREVIQEHDIAFVDRYDSEIETRGITMGMSREDMLTRYLELENIPEDEKEEYVEIGLEAMDFEEDDEEDTEE